MLQSSVLHKSDITMVFTADKCALFSRDVKKEDLYLCLRLVTVEY